MKWLAEGRQASEWPQTLAIILTVKTILSTKPFDVTKLIPSHLRSKNKIEYGLTAEEMAPAWRGGLKSAILGGKVK